MYAAMQCAMVNVTCFKLALIVTNMCVKNVQIRQNLVVHSTFARLVTGYYVENAAFQMLHVRHLAVIRQTVSNAQLWSRNIHVRNNVLSAIKASALTARRWNIVFYLNMMFALVVTESTIQTLNVTSINYHSD